MPDNAAPLIVLTRPQAASARFGAACAARFGAAAEVVIVPLQRIVPLGAVPDLGGVCALIFTSENGATVAAEASDRRDLPVFCVGDRTAEAARAAGFTAQSAGGTADDLVAMLRDLAPDGPVLHLHGRHTRGEVVARLQDAGLRASRAAIYDQVAVPPGAAFHNAMTSDRPVIAPLFSPRSAALFAGALGAAPPARLRLPCLSQAVRGSLPTRLQAAASLCDTPTAPAMLAAIAREVSP